MSLGTISQPTAKRCPQPFGDAGRFETCRSVHPCSPRACGLTEESLPHIPLPQSDTRQVHGEAGSLVETPGLQTRMPWVHSHVLPPTSRWWGRGSHNKLFNVSESRLSPCKVGLITLTPKYGMKIKHNMDSGCHGKGAYGSASNERDTTGFQNSDSSLINEEPGAGKWNDLPRLAQ